MQEHEHTHAQLLSLMEEALRVCMVLQSFTEKKTDIFSGDDDKKIFKVIEDRELIINSLINLEYKIDLILDEVDEYAYGCALPPDIDGVRLAVRKVLGTVIDMDLKAMRLLGSKIQNYKDQTLKARNRKHISAYIKTGLGVSPYSSYDIKK